MDIEQMKDFNSEIIDEVNTYAENEKLTSLEAFTKIFLSYLADAGETRTADAEILSYKKKSDNMRINGYSFSAYFNTLTLLVCDYSRDLEINKIGKTEAEKQLKQALRFFKNCKTDYFSDAEEASNGYRAFQFIKENMSQIDTVHIILLTNKVATLNIPQDSAVDKIIIKYDVWDLDRVWQTVFTKKVAEPLVIRLKNKYDTKLPLIKVGGDNEIYDCYVGIIAGKLLASIYKDEGQKLIEKNVRSYLQAQGKVNRGIRATLSNEPEMFMAYNNGISTIAEKITIDDERSKDNMVYINELSGWQIVNGGQTTASIARALHEKTDLSNVYVQMKLTVIKNAEKFDEIISNISKYANSQNEIKMSDFSANDDYHIAMAQYSRSVYIPSEKGKAAYRWFYERARGQYAVEVNRQPTAGDKNKFKEFNDPKKKISKTVVAKCLMLWRKQPHIVAKGLETNFVEFSELIKKGEIAKPTEESYKSMIAKVILFNECDKIIAGLKFGDWKAQQNCYTIALLSEYFGDMVDDAYIWQNQRISPEVALKIEELSYKVWTHFMKPETKGVNVGQWCKKESCWILLKERYEANKL